MSAAETETKTTPSETVRKHKEFLFPAVATYYQEPIALVQGEGKYVWDDQDNKYLDCFGGVLTVSVGHANPKVNQAIIKQVNASHIRQRFTPISRNRIWRKSFIRSRPAV